MRMNLESAARTDPAAVREDLTFGVQMPG